APGRDPGPVSRMTAFPVKVAAARAAGALSRRSGRGGTSLPGRLLMRLEPEAIGRLASALREGSVVISATNGKTTTAAMAAAILERTGRRLVHNRAGANMAGGIASALPDLQHASDSKHCRRCGAPYVYDAVLLGHLGHYHCPNGDSARPRPAIAAHDVELDGVRAARFTLRTPGGTAPVALPLPGLYNV